MIKVGNNLSLQVEDAKKMMSVAKELVKLAERMYDVADACKCPMKEMLDLEIGLIDQHSALMSIYPDDNSETTHDDDSFSSSSFSSFDD